MDADFDPHLHKVRSAFLGLLGATNVDVDTHPSPIPKRPGVYVFYEDGMPLRVGTARKDLRKRVKQHHGKKHQNAAFSKQLARRKTGIPGSYRKGEGWKDQVKAHPKLQEAFEEAGQDIRKMSVRWVVELDADCRYLLEFYAAKELRTPYNDFRET